MKRHKFMDTAAARWLSNRRNALLVVAGLGLVIWAKPMGLLLWSRIRILTTIPRTAIADDAIAAAPKPKLPPEFDPQLPVTGGAARDPFRVDPAHFPSEQDLRDAQAAAALASASRGTAATPAPAASAVAGAIVEGSPETASPSPLELADEQPPAEYERLRIAAQSLRVQSAGKGLDTAVVGGRAVRVGDVLETADGDEFLLVEVVEGGIVVAAGAREFVVRLPENSTGKVVASPRRGGLR
ncbi:MAG: hypothetical protein GC172_09720 [Phycisphaera sp.]|nr:hypothetical protein [Phycisphaera sp.]